MPKHPEFLNGELTALDWSKDMILLGRKHSFDLLSDERFNEPHARAIVKQYTMLFQTMLNRIEEVQQALVEQGVN